MLDLLYNGITLVQRATFQRNSSTTNAHSLNIQKFSLCFKAFLVSTISYIFGSHMSQHWHHFWILKETVTFCKLFRLPKKKKKIILVRTEVLGVLTDTFPKESIRFVLELLLSLQTSRHIDKKRSTLKILFHVGMKNTLQTFFL